MGGSHFSRVIENAREEVLSSDINRGLDLVSRDVQDSLAYMGADFDSGAPFSGALQIPAVTGDSGGYTATIGAGRGFAWDPSFPGLTADDSGYLVLRWLSQSLTFANPDSTNPRIDVIVGTVTDPDSDTQARNILLDPLSRLFTPQNVNKTSSPVTLLSVVTGTPAGSPVAPNVSAHTVALYEVYVPAAVANASSFSFYPRLWRKAAFPMSALSGPVYGCNLVWDASVDPASASAEMGFAANQQHACMVNGELIVFGGSPAVIQDATANPFATPASATFSRPYYVYLCAGHTLPQMSLGAFGLTVLPSGGFPAPVPAVLVESTVAPDSLGRPVSNITTPRGLTRAGAVYVGLGFVYRNTSNRMPLVQSEGFTRDVGGRAIETFVSTTSPNTFSSIPAASVRGGVDLQAIVTTTGAQIQAGIAINPINAGVPTFSHAQVIEVIDGASGTVGFSKKFRIALDPGSAGVAWIPFNASTVSLDIFGYSTGVRRIAG